MNKTSLALTALFVVLLLLFDRAMDADARSLCYQTHDRGVCEQGYGQ